MSEHNDLLPLRSPEEGGPAFELVRRGYDRDQVENHLGWLEDQLRNAEIARDAAEHAAASAAAEAETAREALESGRPEWHELGERITQILTLAEDQGAEIRLQRTREAEQLLADTREAADQADRTHTAQLQSAREASDREVADAHAFAEQTVAAAQAHAEQTVASAEAHAEQTVASAQALAEKTVADADAEAQRLLTQAQQQTTELDRASSRRLADLERQRDAVNAQLTRLHEALASALSPAISLKDAPAAAPESAVPAPADPGYEDEYTAPGDDDDYAGSASTSAASSSPREPRGRS